MSTYKIKEKRGKYVAKVKISPTKWVTDEKLPATDESKSQASYKTCQLQLIISCICALLNSGGGKLKLCITGTPSRKELSGCFRIIEQKIQEFTTCAEVVSNLIWKECGDKIVINVESTDRLFTVEYNFFVPGHTQVLRLPPSQPEYIRKMIQFNKKILQTATEINSHQKCFVKGEVTELHESKTTQFKQLTSTSTKKKKVTLAKRVTGKTNKFVRYVSAFANYCGGNIYVGINDDGLVMGEEIQEKGEIIEKIANTINGMIWPANCQPKRGIDWEVYFEPVKDSVGNEIANTFVVVVFVAPRPGAVFTEKPKCYHIVESNHQYQVEGMNFDTWKERLVYPLMWQSKQEIGIPSAIGRCFWSSKKLEKVLNALHEVLQTLINNGYWKEFRRKATAFAPEDGDKDDVELFILGKEINASFRKGLFAKAKDDLKKFAELMPRSTNIRCFEVVKLYLEIAMERCSENYECYDKAKKGLSLVETIPVSVLTASIFTLVGTVAGILAGKARSQDEADKFRNEAEEFYNKAVEHLMRCDTRSERIVDIRLKVSINRILLRLKFTLAGDILQGKFTDEDMKVAISEMEKMDQFVRTTYPKSPFREIQCHFVEAALCYQRSQENGGDRKFLEAGLRHSNQARSESKECCFNEMKAYSENRIAFFTEKLLQNRKGHESQENDETADE